MGIKTVPQPPYNPDLVPCDLWLFPKLSGCRYETIEEMKEAVTKVIAHTRRLPWSLPEVVGTVEVHCSRRRLLQRGLEFHVCTINKSAHTKKVWKLIQWSLCVYIYIYIYIYIRSMWFKRKFFICNFYFLRALVSSSSIQMEFFCYLTSPSHHRAEVGSV